MQRMSGVVNECKINAVHKKCLLLSPAKTGQYNAVVVLGVFIVIIRYFPPFVFKLLSSRSGLLLL